MAKSMIDSASVSDIERMIELHALGIDYNTKNSYGSAAIHFAAQLGQTKSLVFLINQGVDVEIPGECGYTPLQFAIRNDKWTTETNRSGKVECAKILILRCNARLNYPYEYRWAAKNHLLELIMSRQLVDINECALMLMKAHNEEKTLTTHNNDDTSTLRKTVIHISNHDEINVSEDAIKWAIENDEMLLFRKFVFGSCSVPRESVCRMFATCNSIFWSCRPDNIEYMKIILDNGGNVFIDSLGYYPSPPDLVKRTMLHAAVMASNCEMVNLLLSYGANIWATTNREYDTALHLAALSKDIEIAKVLIRHLPCDRLSEYLNQKNRFGNTALHCAAKIRNHGVLGVLVLNGADITIKNNDGDIPHDLLKFDKDLIKSHALLEIDP